MAGKSNKPRSLKAVKDLVRKARKNGKKIVTTNGCFDILHVGHVRSLRAAKRLGDVLIVGVNSDASVRAIKGSGRPIVPGRERAEMLAALDPVDGVFIFGEKDPKKWIAQLKPDVHVKGKERNINEYIEKEVVERGGGKLVLISLRKGKSTTNIIKKIRDGK